MEKWGWGCNYPLERTQGKLSSLFTWSLAWRQVSLGQKPEPRTWPDLSVSPPLLLTST